MCGASSEQKQLQQQQMDFYADATAHADKTFGEQQDMLANLRGVYDPILAKGPNQMGFNDEQLDTLNTQAIEGTATNYHHAAQALNEELAAQGGGNIPVTTGGEVQLKSQLASSAAEHQSEQQQKILQAGYAQGYNEFELATNALATASGELAPVNYTNAATNAGSAAEQTAKDITDANNSWINAAIGAAGAVGGGWAGSGFKH